MEESTWTSRARLKKKRAASFKRLQQKCAEEPKTDKGPAIQECDKDAVIRLMEGNDENRQLAERMSVESNTEVEKKMREYLAAVHVLGTGRETSRDAWNVESGWRSKRMKKLEEGETASKPLG